MKEKERVLKEGHYETREQCNTMLLIEVLCDIRDQLTKLNESVKEPHYDTAMDGALRVYVDH